MSLSFLHISSHEVWLEGQEQERKGNCGTCRSLVRPEARKGIMSSGQVELGINRKD